MNDNNNDNKAYDSRPNWYLNKIKRNADYNKQNMKQFKIALNINSDLDIIEKLENVDNKSGYLKKLIREDIKNSENNNY